MGRHHQSWLQEREFWKRACFIHWLLRGCAGNWIEIGAPRQTAISNSTSTTKHKLKNGRLVWKFSRFPGKFVSVKAVTHTVVFFLEAKDLFLREKGSNKTQLFFEDIKFQKWYFYFIQGKSPLVNTVWLRVVLDEGHVIRNPSAMMSKAVHALKADRRWVVTGTPIQNSMKDLFSIISFLKLEPFTDRQWWRRTMERPISEGDETALGYSHFHTYNNFFFLGFKSLWFDWFDGYRIRTHRLLVGSATSREVNQYFALTSLFLYSAKLWERIERCLKFTEGFFGAKRVTFWIMYSCHGVFTDQFIF